MEDAAEKKVAKRGRKPKAQDLPGMVGPGVAKERYEDVEAAADDYVDLRDRRMAVQLDEKKAKEALIAALHAHDLKCYDYDGKVVTLMPKDTTETVKVKVKDDVEVDHGAVGAGEDPDE